MDKELFLVIVHMPHKSIVNAFSHRLAAYEYFCKTLNSAAEKYGDHDFNGASLEHCRCFGFYQVKPGYFIQLYETVLDREEEIAWL